MALEQRLHARCGCTSVGSAGHASAGRPFVLPSSTRHFERDRPFAIDHLSLDITLDVVARGIRATAALDIRRVDPTAESLALDAIGFEIQGVTVDSRPAVIQYDGRTLLVPIDPASSVARVEVTYRATPRRGLYFLEPDEHYPDRPRQVWSQCQEDDARHWFPCHDSPHAKMTTEIVARVPPCYGEASVEKIAANAVMAGCEPKMMRVLVPLVRAVCDERFNIHGVQATTHFAAPLVIVNGPVRNELGFAYRQNVFSNVARANSTLGRALQLILLNIGGGRPEGIDMSALGNPGKFSYCIAEHEESVPWEPLHVEQGLRPEQSALTLFAGEPPHGVSEHNAREPKQALKAICYALRTVWTYRDCMRSEAIVILCPEHARTVAKAGWTKRQARDFLFENTGVPVREYETVGEAEGIRGVAGYKEIQINGEPCYQKFRSPEDIRIVVAGGTAGKFSAVIGSWTTGPRGSQMVTYPI